MLFSQRKGLRPVKSVMQVDSVDDDLKIGLWNALDVFYWSGFNSFLSVSDQSRVSLLLHFLWRDYFKKTVDTIPSSGDRALAILKDYFFTCAWYGVYDFIEFIANSSPADYFENEKFVSFCNVVLERELSAYRFVDSKLIQITSEEEIGEIEEALTDLHKPVAKHLSTALDLLSDRKSPDYRNSIKESISAVEAACNLITGSKATLGQALKALEAKTNLHPALRNALSSLYGYTSDADGIRHALLEEENLDFADAKFMLVSCSAFVNYLRSKSSKN
jgi:AbiJ N-terminal domain 4